MEKACVRHTDLPHTSALFADLLYRFERVAAYYDHDPSQDGALPAVAAAIEYPEERRARLVAALRAQNGASAALDRLAQPGSVAVLTGQQVGLFSGPAYTLYKALTAIKLASRLSAQGIPATAVFWLAAEDHDWAEVRSCRVFDAAGEPLELALAAEPAAGRPVGNVPLENPPIERLREALGGFPFGEQVAALAERAYAPGRTMGAAFAELLRAIVRPLELVTLDPLDPALRTLAAPLLARAVEAAGDLTEALLARNAELAGAGYHAQVHVARETALFFLLDGGRRLALRRDNGGYVTPGRRFEPAELRERASELSPNALLRPVVEDYLLPTAAYVGGPAELAYMAQAQVLYHALLGRMPVIAPRASFTLLDAASAGRLERYGLALGDCTHGEEALRARIGRRLAPPSLGQAFERTRSETAEALDRLRGELACLDATLAAALETSRRKILYQVAKIERKAGREVLNRSGRAAQEASRLCRLIYPERRLQERYYTILPFLAAHGLDLPARLYENVHLDCPNHHLLVV